MCSFRLVPGRRTRAFLVSGVLAAASVFFGADALADSAEAPATTCRNVAVPVRAGTQTGPLSGTLCVPPRATTVQLLVPGWTYNRNYWQTPYRPGADSYQQAANRAGYATLAIDRLGTGASLRPLSVFDTMQNDLASLDSVVRALRAGELGPRFSRVIGVGHSYGSILVDTTAREYGGFDALITTGFSHVLNYGNAAAEIIGHAYLASGDEKFAGLGLDPLYVTSQPGTRDIFYHAPNVHPSVKKIDEKDMKDTDSVINAATLLNYSVPNRDPRLNVPVLNVTGDHDQFFCGVLSADCVSSAALREYERQWYAPGTEVEAFLVPDTGHNATLELTAPQSFRRMLDFADRHVGRGSGVTGSPAGTLPKQPAPHRGKPDVAARLANEALLRAVKPVVDTYPQLVAGVPGLGTTRNPSPELATLLARLSNALGSVTSR